MAAVALAVGVTSGTHHHSGHRPAADRQAARAIAWARAQIGKPYAWGATGPGSFDCSGLVMMAWRHVGVTLPRTSQQQWAEGHQVAHPRPGDLVFFAGAPEPGAPPGPGHVGLVTGRHKMIEAYSPGFPVRRAPFGVPWAAPGDTDPVGFTRPEAGA